MPPPASTPPRPDLEAIEARAGARLDFDSYGDLMRWALDLRRDVRALLAYTRHLEERFKLERGVTDWLRDQREAESARIRHLEALLRAVLASPPGDPSGVVISRELWERVVRAVAPETVNWRETLEKEPR